ncbi:MAG: hypothetical protein LBP22_04250 [Deltaproteobacteria bacterium]|jgi:hypothetical protein|nr:hypothetical protein [Deltaproteobacteria bacterium]
MVIRCTIKLTAEEREELNTLTHTRKADSRTALSAGTLLLSEPEPYGPGWTNKSVCESPWLCQRVRRNG